MSETTISAVHRGRHPALAHQFESLEQQKEAATLGMWVFLVTEVLFFGGLFAAYCVYRSWYPDAFAAASHELDIVLGSDQHGRAHHQQSDDGAGGPRGADGRAPACCWFLLATMVLGAMFLGIKGVEYYHKFAEHHVPGPRFGSKPSTVSTRRSSSRSTS